MGTTGGGRRRRRGGIVCHRRGGNSLTPSCTFEVVENHYSSERVDGAEGGSDWLVGALRMVGEWW